MRKKNWKIIQCAKLNVMMFCSFENSEQTNEKKNTKETQFWMAQFSLTKNINFLIATGSKLTCRFRIINTFCQIFRFDVLMNNAFAMDKLQSIKLNE